MSAFTKRLFKMAIVLSAVWMINGAVAQQLPVVPHQEQQLDWVTKPPPWVIGARAALIRRDPSFGPGKIDLTKERVMVSAVSLVTSLELLSKQQRSIPVCGYDRVLYECLGPFEGCSVPGTA
jgi:hypothetical protein